MPTFRVKNLSITLGESIGNQYPQQICKFLTPYCINPTKCSFPSVPCLWPTPCNYQTPIACLTPSCYGVSDPCGYFTPQCPAISNDPCGPAWSTLPPTTFRTFTDVIKTVEDPGVIDLLRNQLEEALTAAKDRGVEIEESLRPQTLRDVEALEDELKGALDEIRSMKKKMSK